MKILYITSFFPFPLDTGGKLRVGNLMRQMSKRHEVYLAALELPEEDFGDEDLAEAKRYCREVYTHYHPKSDKKAALGTLFTFSPYEINAFRDKAFSGKVAEMAQRIQPDVIWCSRLAATPFVPFDYPCLKVLDQHDLNSRLWGIMSHNAPSMAVRLFAHYNRLLVLRYERAMFPRFDVSISVSETERQLTKTLVPGDFKTLTVANGVDTDHYRPLDEPHKPWCVLVGSMNQRRNADAACYFAHDMFPKVRAEHPGAQFYVVGRDPSPEVQALAQIDGVVITGRVDDVRPYLNQAAVVVAPFRMGSGVKHKIPIAMSLGKAIVTTSNGCHGIAAENGVDAFIEDSPAAFSERVCFLLSQQDFRKKMGAAARKLVVSKYSWQGLFEQLEHEIDHIRHAEHGR